MKWLALVTAVGLVGCVGGPGDGFGGDGGAGSSSGSSGNGSSGASSSTSTSSSGASGSGGSTLIKASDFIQACATASDCVAVFQGDACSVCACPNAAIATSDQAAYQSQLSSARATCGPQPAIACAACVAVTTVCAGGKCGVTIGVTPRDAGAD